jgi:hypothetical protein
MLLFIIFIPLLNTLIIQLFGFLLNKKNLLRLVCFNMVFILFLTYFLIYEVILCDTKAYLKLGN